MYETPVTQATQVYVSDTTAYNIYYAVGESLTTVYTQTFSNFQVVNTAWTWGGSSASDWSIQTDSTLIVGIGINENRRYLGTSIYSGNPPPRANYVCGAIYFDDSDTYTQTRSYSTPSYGQVTISIDEQLIREHQCVVRTGGVWKYCNPADILRDGSWRAVDTQKLKVGNAWNDIVNEINN